MHVHYDMVVTSHITQDSTQVIDSLKAKCGYISVTDSLIILYPDKKPKVEFNVTSKFLDIDCKCYYYLSEKGYDKYLIVVEDKKYFVMVGKLDLDVFYMTMYYYKFPNDEN